MDGLSEKNIELRGFMFPVLKQLFILCKGGIVVFIVIGGIAGYSLGFEIEGGFLPLQFFLTLFGLAVLSAGSFALNQVQEAAIDRKMKRTKARPIASGWMGRIEATGIGLLLVGIGLVSLHIAEPLAALLGLFTVILYNIFYTMFWKRYWAFGAVPGAIPGAMPVVIGYAAVRGNIFTAECLYLFLVLYLWQMPHFWAIAIRLKDDYAEAGVPVLPVRIGVQRTLFHIGLYTFVYLALAIASPWFVSARYLYIFLVIPLAGKLLWEFIKYFRSEGREGWMPFFIWTNISVLVFLLAPAIDKWFWVVRSIRLATIQ